MRVTFKITSGELFDRKKNASEQAWVGCFSW